MGDDISNVLEESAGFITDIFLGQGIPRTVQGFGGPPSLGGIVDSFITGGLQIPEFSPSGMGGSAGPVSIIPGSKSFELVADSGFRRTSTSPQSPRAIIIGTYTVSGAILDTFLLGTNNRRQLVVIGIAKPPVTNNQVLIDDIDITTLPNFIDVTAGGTPDDNKPWMHYFGSGGSSGDILLTNSGKKAFDIGVEPGEVNVTPNIEFFNVVSGNSEARLFVSVNVPGVYVDSLQTVDADYTGISTKTLSITYVAAGAVVDTTQVVTFTDAMKTVSPDYTGLNGLTMIFTVDGSNRTATFDAGDVDAATVAAQINTDIGAWVTAVASGTDVIVYNDTHGSGGTLVDSGTGTASAKLGFTVFNDATSCENNIDGQTGAGLNSSVIDVDEINFESANDDNKRLKFSGTGFSQLNILSQNYGTTVSYTLSKQEKDSSAQTIIASETDRDLEDVASAQARPITLLTGLQRLETENAAFALTGLDLDVTVAGTVRTVTFTAAAIDTASAVIEINDQIGTWVTASVINTDEIRIETTTGGLSVGGAANAQLNFAVVDGNFYFDTSIDNLGSWSFILDVSKATNGAIVSLVIVEVMSDFIITDSGTFSGVAGQTLILEINGTQQTVTFGVGTNTAALAIIDINAQLGTSVLATASGDEILIEALASPEGTKSVAEIKKIKLIGGTASSDMNFIPLYAETKNYDFDDAFAIINLVSDRRISGNPRYTFKATGASTNPAQNILDIHEGAGNYFSPGINIPQEIDRNSFLNSIDFDTVEGFQCNMAILDPSSAEVIQALKDAGSLMLIENAGRYKLIPETDSQPAAELHVTDDFELDAIIRDSWSGVTIDETRKFNVLRITYPDEEEEYIQRDIIIDITGEVDTENNVKPQILEKGELINITDSEFDSIRATTRNLAAVTSRDQALRIGNQIFRKQLFGNIIFTFSVSIRHYFLEIGDVVSIFIDELAFIGKQFRILDIKENPDLGFRLTCSEHFPQMYQ